MECCTHQGSINVFKNLKTLGSPKCLKWPVSYFIYFTLHCLLGKGLLGTAQLPHWLDILNSGSVALESMRLIVYWMLYHLKIEENLKAHYKELLFFWTSDSKSHRPWILQFVFFSTNKAIPLHQSSRCGASKPTALISPNDWLEMGKPDCPPDLPNQKLWDEVSLYVS